MQVIADVIKKRKMFQSFSNFWLFGTFCANSYAISKIVFHRKCDKINKQTYKFLQKDHKSKWYCIICTKNFLLFSDLNDEEFLYTAKGKKLKFTHVAPKHISNKNTLTGLGNCKKTTRHHLHLSCAKSRQTNNGKWRKWPKTSVWAISGHIFKEFNQIKQMNQIN